MTPTTPLFLQVLADAKGQPGSLLWDLAPSAPSAPPIPADAAAQWPAEALAEALHELALRWPCFYRDNCPADAAAALRALGWQVLPAGATRRADVPADLAAPAQAPWTEGEWFLAPPPKPAGQQAVSRALALQMLQLVSADADTHEIESLLRRDATLSYHLLRLVNSLGVGSGRRVSSFSQAILILGRAQLRRWLNLMLFCARDGDTRSAMLLARVAVRARAMELLAKEAGMDRQQQELAFMTGMFSLLGVLFGQPLAEVLQPLTIALAVQQALLQHEGELGALLALLEHSERGDAAALSARLMALGVALPAFNLSVAQAHGWMQGVAAGMAGPGHA